MLGKTMAVLKHNPLLFVVLLAFIIPAAALSLLLIPDMNRMMEMYQGMSDYSQYPLKVDVQDTMFLMTASLKMLLYSLISCAFALVISAGYGNMIAAAVNDGKASLKVFLYGIRKFTGKVILSALLLAAIITGVSIIISIVTTPFIIAGAINGSFNPKNMMRGQKVIQAVTYTLMLFLYPLIIMWFPAIFTDRGEGVMACFRNGFRAGVRKYLHVMPLVGVILLPTLLLLMLSENIYTVLENPFFYLVYVYQAIAVPVLAVLLFLLYRDYKAGLRNLSISV